MRYVTILVALATLLFTPVHTQCASSSINGEVFVAAGTSGTNALPSSRTTNVTISATSTVADGGVAFSLNSSNLLTSGNSKQLSLVNYTNENLVVNAFGGINGGIGGASINGQNVSVYYTFDESLGDPTSAITALELIDSQNYNYYAASYTTVNNSATAPRSHQEMHAQKSGGNLNEIDLDVGGTGNGFATLSMTVNGISRVSLNPSSADGVTSHVFDTSTAHTTGNLLELKNAGTNVVQLRAPHGGLALGRSVDYWWSSDAPISGVLAVANGELGEGTAGIGFTANYFNETSGTNHQAILSTDVGGASLQLFAASSGGPHLRLAPHVGATITPYRANTTITHTSGNLLEVENNGTDTFTVTSAGRTITPSDPPANASAPGVAGSYTWDANFFYVCVATDTWKRVAIATW